MNVTEQEAARLLSDLRCAAINASNARQERDDLIRAAMKAEVPRAKIARAAGLARSALYKIMSQDVPKVDTP